MCKLSGNLAVLASVLRVISAFRGLGGCSLNVPAGYSLIPKTLEIRVVLGLGPPDSRVGTRCHPVKRPSRIDVGRTSV